MRPLHASSDSPVRRPSASFAGTRAAVAVCLVVLAAGALAGTASPTPSQPSERLLVGFQPGTSSLARGRAAGLAGAVGGRALARLGVRVLEVPRGSSAQALAQVRSTPGVAFAEPDGQVSVAETVPNDPLTRLAWQHALPRFPLAWDLTRGVPEVTIAIVDTGVDRTHVDLQRVTAGYDFVNADSDPRDDHGHGTLVAGIAAARTNNGQGIAGACWRCSVMPVKVLGASGSGSWSAVAAGIVWAADHGADVVNLSLGAPAGSQAVAAAVAYARARGVVVAAAAGNEGSTQPFYPADHDGVLSVAASHEDDGLYGFSNRGSGVDVAAPGCARSTRRGGGYLEACGTSVAAPFVAGLAGLALSAVPAASPAAVAHAIAGAPASLAGSGLARIDARSTLEALGAVEGAPVSLRSPRVAGSARVGSRLRVAVGSWAGSALRFRIAWLRCSRAGKSCRTVASGPGTTYVLRRADRGKRLRADVRAANGLGSARAASAPTRVVRRR